MTSQEQIDKKEVRSGHDSSRASQVERVALLDDEGDLSPKFEVALIRIFARFSSSYKGKQPQGEATRTDGDEVPQRPGRDDVLTEAELDEFAKATNGEPLPQESKDEIREFLDTDDTGSLTFRGFCEMFHLQSDNEPEETWKDLVKLGFDHQLNYIGHNANASGSSDDGAGSDPTEKTAGSGSPKNEA
ncbi:hypothetical protein BCV70DRAFT_234575 [Testicularia cyperi]|uniref:EF-hand domain-containing protein n=1 Tax=Testicularia cyperi TaxID=1882483 RepID=A0A317XX03_9BASI|nr:hypothetical protein BCV70DRAFT_234575 [Testicularia cyperi]